MTTAPIPINEYWIQRHTPLDLSVGDYACVVGPNLGSAAMLIGRVVDVGRTIYIECDSDSEPYEIRFHNVYVFTPMTEGERKEASQNLELFKRLLQDVKK